MVNNLPANAGDADLILGSGVSPGEEILKYFCLDNPMERVAWQTSEVIDISPGNLDSSFPSPWWVSIAACGIFHCGVRASL